MAFNLLIDISSIDMNGSIISPEISANFLFEIHPCIIVTSQLFF